MIRIRISDEALHDLNDGFLFYEVQQSGLGDYFASCLRADIESLRVTTGMHRIVYRDYHRLLSRIAEVGMASPGKTPPPASPPQEAGHGKILIQVRPVDSNSTSD